MTFCNSNKKKRHLLQNKRPSNTFLMKTLDKHYTKIESSKCREINQSRAVKQTTKAQTSAIKQ